MMGNVGIFLVVLQLPSLEMNLWRRETVIGDVVKIVIIFHFIDLICMC